MKMIPDRLIIEDEQFWAIFQPQKNHLDDDAAYDGYMYSLGDDELEYVKSQKPEHVWTIVEGDTMIIILSGLHFCNRMGYLITKKSKPEGIEFEVQDDNLKKQFIINVDTILHIAKDVFPDMEYGDAEELYNNISDEIYHEATNAILYRLKEKQAE